MNPVSDEKRWLDWAQRLQALGQTGLFYNPPPFDRERYEAVLLIAAEIIAAHGTLGMPALSAVFHEQQGHATPKVDVRAAIFRDEHILLVQEKLDNNRWTLPGGWADVGESAAESCVREVYEETGYRARAIKLLAVYDRNKHEHPPHLFHVYKLFFMCELLDDERVADPDNIESGEVGWFREDDLPDLSVGRVTAKQITRFFDHLHNPTLMTDFD